MHVHFSTLSDCCHSRRILVHICLMRMFLDLSSSASVCAHLLTSSLPVLCPQSSDCHICFYVRCVSVFLIFHTSSSLLLTPLVSIDIYHRWTWFLHCLTHLLPITCSHPSIPSLHNKFSNDSYRIDHISIITDTTRVRFIVVKLRGTQCHQWIHRELQCECKSTVIDRTPVRDNLSIISSQHTYHTSVRTSHPSESL